MRNVRWWRRRLPSRAERLVYPLWHVGHKNEAGDDGDALAYQAWSYSTADGRRQATVGLTSKRPADPADAVHALLDDAFCDQ
ncbi:hypothetical protein [Streptomyces niveus]|uniref:hypothetical protein n=1 Tax=Streptomyces niveus TaxID=193462 RepID=UPI0034353734